MGVIEEFEQSELSPTNFLVQQDPTNNCQNSSQLRSQNIKQADEKWAANPDLSRVFKTERVKKITDERGQRAVTVQDMKAEWQGAISTGLVCDKMSTDSVDGGSDPALQ